MIYKAIEKSKKNNKLIGFKLYGDTGCWYGIVNDFDNDFIEIKLINKFGELDGITVERIANVERIDISDEYLKNLELLYKNKDKIRDIETPSRVFETINEEEWQYDILKLYLKDEKQMLSIQINSDDYYRGFVRLIDKSCFEFEIIDHEGNSNGISLFKIDDVSSIKINDLECRRRLFIYKLNKKSFFKL